MKRITQYLSLLLFSLVLASCTNNVEELSQEDSLKVLFIGNSYLYYNSAPELFNAMVKQKFPNKRVVTKLISDGGMTLEGHLNGGRAMQAIKSDKWDYVVLQEQSGLAGAVIIDGKRHFGSPELFFESSKRFYHAIKQTGAKTLFLMTWAQKSEPQNQKYLSYAYTTIANRLNSKVIPVGIIWDKLNQHTDFDLYHNDGSHPSIYGSYLVASSVFTSIFDTSPVGIPGNLTGYSLNNLGDKSFTKTRLSSLSNEQSASIQNAVWDVISAFGTKSEYPEPEVSYVIPELPKGFFLSERDLSGSWFGESRFDFVSNGLQLDFQVIDGKLNAKISVVRDEGNIAGEVTKLDKTDNGILINFTDGTNRVRELKMVWQDGHLQGIIHGSLGNYIKYDSIKFTRVAS